MRPTVPAVRTGPALSEHHCAPAAVPARRPCPAVKTLPAPGLYAITDAGLTGPRGLEACVAQALRGGAVMVQHRDKDGDSARRRRDAERLVALCKDAGVPLIVNDDVALAREVGAAGVHLGRDDPAPASARAVLGPDAIIGVSCYHDLERARSAAAAGADYVAFGRFFPSRSKPGEALATPALLREASTTLPLPVAAIGGITAGNGRALVRAGARWLAVIHDLWSAEDCEARARLLGRCFD